MTKQNYFVTKNLPKITILNNFNDYYIMKVINQIYIPKKTNVFEDIYQIPILPFPFLIVLLT